MKNEKAIIIGGGVGPMAGVDLHKKIIENTITDGTDQTHFEIIHISRSYDIPDRTEYLLGKTNVNPSIGMAKAIIDACKAIGEQNKNAVAGITCNTFHAPQIFNNLISIINKSGTKLSVLNMVEETIKYIKTKYRDINKIGILSTTGTRDYKIYENRLLSSGYKTLQITHKLQHELHNTIYNKKWGIKAQNPISKKAKQNIDFYADELIKSNVELIILGCTEIPLVLTGSTYKNIPLLNPVNILSLALINNANPTKGVLK